MVYAKGVLDLCKFIIRMIYLLKCNGEKLIHLSAKEQILFKLYYW